MRKISEQLGKFGMLTVSYQGPGQYEYLPAFTRGIMDTHIEWDLPCVPKYRIVLSSDLVKYNIKVVALVTSPGETLIVVFENPTEDELRLPYGKKILSVVLF